MNLNFSRKTFIASLAGGALAFGMSAGSYADPILISDDAAERFDSSMATNVEEITAYPANAGAGSGGAFDILPWLVSCGGAAEVAGVVGTVASPCTESFVMIANKSITTGPPALDETYNLGVNLVPGTNAFDSQIRFTYNMEVGNLNRADCNLGTNLLPTEDCSYDIFSGRFIMEYDPDGFDTGPGVAETLLNLTITGNDNQAGVCANNNCPAALTIVAKNTGVAPDFVKPGVFFDPVTGADLAPDKLIAQTTVSKPSFLGPLSAFNELGLAGVMCPDDINGDPQCGDVLVLNGGVTDVSAVGTNNNVTFQIVSEPSMLGLLGIGLVVAGFGARRRVA